MPADTTPSIALRGAAVEVALADGTAEIVFTANTLAAVEEKYGSLPAWQEAMTNRPYGSVRDTLAIALGRDPLEVGEAMLPTRMQDYATAIAAAFTIANGMDPTEALTMAQEAAARRAARIADLTATPGPSGSRRGAKSVAPTASSGT